MKRLIYTFLMSLICLMIYSQDNYILDSKNSTITIKGTSTFHDWEASSNAAVIDLLADIKDSEVKRLSSVNLLLKVVTLKSDSRRLDRKIYKALKANDYPYITFVLTKVVHLSNQKIEVEGNLTINGVTRKITVNQEVTFNNNGEEMIIVLGSKKINMKDFGVKPPKFLFGAFKTGRFVTVDFHIYFRRINTN